jgi:hypothetical protein
MMTVVPGATGSRAAWTRRLARARERSSCAEILAVTTTRPTSEPDSVAHDHSFQHEAV